MTLVFFAVSGLDVLGSLESLSAKEREDIVEWIYAQQILPGEDGSDSHCGFRGASFIGAPFQVKSMSINHQRRAVFRGNDLS